MQNQKGSWWRHQVGTFSALLDIWAGISPPPGEFPTQRQVTRNFDVFFDLRPNKRLIKQWWGWSFETQSRPLWRHRNVIARRNLLGFSCDCCLICSMFFNFDDLQFTSWGSNLCCWFVLLKQYVREMLYKKQPTVYNYNKTANASFTRWVNIDGSNTRMLRLLIVLHASTISIASKGTGSPSISECAIEFILAITF